MKQMPLPDTNVIVEFHMYDCAGASIFNQVEMNAKYYENAAAVAATDWSSGRGINGLGMHSKVPTF